ncbi:MAG: hypothetical protein AAFQ18_07820 [Pseudomonadota bacterium]
MPRRSVGIFGETDLGLAIDAPIIAHDAGVDVGWHVGSVEG